MKKMKKVILSINKEMHVIPEAGYFDMYDLYPYVSEAFNFIKPFFTKSL